MLVTLALSPFAILNLPSFPSMFSSNTILILQKRQSDNFIYPRECETFILKLTTSSLAPFTSLDPAETCALACTFSGTKVCFACLFVFLFGSTLAVTSLLFSCSEVPVSELSLELLLLQVVLPALLEQGHTRQWLKNVMHGWAVTAAYLL